MYHPLFWLFSARASDCLFCGSCTIRSYTCISVSKMSSSSARLACNRSMKRNFIVGVMLKLFVLPLWSDEFVAVMLLFYLCKNITIVKAHGILILRTFKLCTIQELYNLIMMLWLPMRSNHLTIGERQKILSPPLSLFLCQRHYFYFVFFM